MFTLAHLSDPHLAPLPAPRWRELINKRITGYINWQRRRRFIHDAGVLAKIVADLKAQAADHIAVTGDLCNIALEEEFARGRKWLQDLGSLRDVSLVPGNHDAYVRQAVRYAPQWAPYMSGDDGAVGFPYLRRRGPLALIGLSTAVSTPPFMATGRLSAPQLARLGETLAALAHERLFRVVLIHHPPVSPAKRHKLLTDAAEFLHVIRANGAELVLHGHDHLHMLNWLSGPDGARIPAVGVPSASAAWGASKDAAAYNLYAIGGAPGAWSCEMIARGVGAAGTLMQQRRIKLLG
ncbi:MAG TPA: metallophosphoesterase [Pseudolabrys sp.]|jgi:3',5'-cyclic AMP phosphodiesterase CpdA